MSSVFRMIQGTGKRRVPPLSNPSQRLNGYREQYGALTVTMIAERLKLERVNRRVCMECAGYRLDRNWHRHNTEILKLQNYGEILAEECRSDDDGWWIRVRLSEGEWRANDAYLARGIQDIADIPGVEVVVPQTSPKQYWFIYDDKSTEKLIIHHLTMLKLHWHRIVPELYDPQDLIL